MKTQSYKMTETCKMMCKGMQGRVCIMVMRMAGMCKRMSFQIEYCVLMNFVFLHT